MPEQLFTPLDLLALMPVDNCLCGRDDISGETVLLVKLPRKDAERCRHAPVQLSLVAWECEYGPVVQLIVSIFHPDGRRWLDLDTFFNVAEIHAAGNLQQLTKQKRLKMFYYDERMNRVCAQQIPWHLAGQAAEAAEFALASLARIPLQTRDFDKAKALFMLQFPLGGDPHANN